MEVSGGGVEKEVACPTWGMGNREGFRGEVNLAPY